MLAEQRAIGSEEQRRAVAGGAVALDDADDDVRTVRRGGFADQAHGLVDARLGVERDRPGLDHRSAKRARACMRIQGIPFARRNVLFRR